MSLKIIHKCALETGRTLGQQQIFNSVFAYRVSAVSTFALCIFAFLCNPPNLHSKNFVPETLILIAGSMVVEFIGRDLPMMKISEAKNLLGSLGADRYIFSFIEERIAMLKILAFVTSLMLTAASFNLLAHLRIKRISNDRLALAGCLTAVARIAAFLGLVQTGIRQDVALIFKNCLEQK